MNITIKADTTIKQLRIWNGIFNLTDKELEILGQLIDVNTSNKDDNLCSVKNKKSAAKNLKISDYNTLNNYVKRFKDKGVVSLKNKKYVLNKLLHSDVTDVRIRIKQT
jgi:hypothetical protein